MTLFIDTTDNDSVRVALILNGEVISKEWHTKFLSKTLMPETAKLLKKNKRKFTDVKKVVVVRGPGFFSRTRTGVGVANALAFGLNVPVAGIKKSQIPSDLMTFKQLKFSKSVLPYYDKAPNISKPKRR